MNLLELIDELKTIFSPEETYKFIERIKTILANNNYPQDEINFTFQYKLERNKISRNGTNMYFYTVYKVVVTVPYKSEKIVIRY